MMIAMAAMRMVEVASNQIVHMITMRNRFMATGRTMNMIGWMSGAVVPRGAIIGVRTADSYRMLIIMIAMMVVQVAIVQKINMVLVDKPGVAAPWTVYVNVVGVRMDDV